MVRIAGIDLPEEKRIDIGLTAIYGVGRVNVVNVLKEAKVEAARRVKDLTNEEVSRLQKAVEKLPVEGVLRKKVSQDIERLKSIKCYRGIRHIQNLPVRGQRTRSNARTKRGKRKTIGAIKKKDMARFGGGKEGENES
jgi:small subunit ribosomal protein S13